MDGPYKVWDCSGERQRWCWEVREGAGRVYARCLTSTDASLIDADLTYANLTGAKLTEAD